MENYGHPDYECCTEEIDDRIAMGEWCSVKPLEHGGDYMDGERDARGKFQYKKPAVCLECQAEGGQKHAANA